VQQSLGCLYPRQHDSLGHGVPWSPHQPQCSPRRAVSSKTQDARFSTLELYSRRGWPLTPPDPAGLELPRLKLPLRKPLKGPLPAAREALGAAPPLPTDAAGCCAVAGADAAATAEALPVGVPVEPPCEGPYMPSRKQR